MWRELKLPVTPSVYLFEDHIVYQIENIMDFLAEKSEDYIERIHQDGKRSEKRYCRLTNFQQSQISQLKNNDMMTTLKVKSEQIKKESKRNQERER